jgi:hypothetical protein
VDIDLRIGFDFVATQPAVFARAAGELDGVAFDQQDHWHLLYVPEHHHTVRSAIVLFDEPIAGAAGLMATEFEPLMEDPPAALALVDDGLEVIETLTITGETFQTLAADAAP